MPPFLVSLYDFNTYINPLVAFFLVFFVQIPYYPRLYRTAERSIGLIDFLDL